MFVSLGYSPSFAAEIQATDDRLCALKLEGKIVAGDYDRFANLIRNSHLDPLDERTITLCLKSPGGSYSEGLKIAELVYSSGISTLVADRSECFSACAIVFMAGVLPDHIIPYRKLSAGGIVGFHAPYLLAAEGKYSKEEMEGAANQMRLAILGLVRLSMKQTHLDLLTRVAANDEELSRLHLARPAGVPLHLRNAEMEARNLASFTRDTPSVTKELKLADWQRSNKFAWPQPKPHNMSTVAPMPYDRRYSGDWCRDGEERAAARQAEQERGV